MYVYSLYYWLSMVIVTFSVSIIEALVITYRQGIVTDIIEFLHENNSDEVH